MIFLTIGSHEPYDRLVTAVDLWCAHNPHTEVFGQITDKGSYQPRHFKTVPYLSAKQYDDVCAKTTFFVAHAGMGSIITALTLGKPIVMMPRRAHLGEMRNDHQVATSVQFRGRPLIFVADDEGALPAQIDAARSSERSRTQIPPFAQDQLVQFLKSEIAKA